MAATGLGMASRRTGPLTIYRFPRGPLAEAGRRRGPPSDGRNGRLVKSESPLRAPWKRYFRTIEGSVDRAYEVADRARKEGLDPAVGTEIPRAQDMASRVEKLLAHLGIEGISTEIRALAATMPREEVAVSITRRIAQDASRGGSTASRVDAALRVGLAILTEGILVAPLEGLAEVHLHEGRDGAPYIELYLRGPDSRGRRDGPGVERPSRRHRPPGPGARGLPRGPGGGRAVQGGDSPVQVPSAPPVRTRRPRRSSRSSPTSPSRSPASRPRGRRRSARSATSRGSPRTGSGAEPAS